MFAKNSADLPKQDQHFGKWGGNYSLYQLPGGSVLQIDLSKLTVSDFRQMKDDFYIALCLNLIKFHFYQLDWEIECPGSPRIAEAVQRLLRDMWTPLSRTISRAFWAGYSPNVKVWETDKYSKLYTIGKFRDIGPEGCDVFVGNTPEEKNRNEFRGIKQNNQIIAPKYSFWYALGFEGGDWFGQKLLRPAFAPWFMSQVMHLYTNRYYERFGEPIPVGHAPFDEMVQDSDGNASKGADVMLTILEKLRNHSVAVLPSDRDVKDQYKYDIKYLASEMRGVEFERYLARLDKEKALAMMTPQLLFENGEVGSYNLGAEHKKTFLTLQNGIAGDIKHYLDRYIIRPLVEYNFGTDAPRATFKYKMWGRVNDELIQSILQALAQGGTAAPDLKELSKYLQMEIVAMEPPNKEAAPVEPPKDSGKLSMFAKEWQSPRALTPREQVVDFGGIVNLFSHAQTSLKAELVGIIADISSRLEGQVSRAYAGKNPLAEYQKISLGYKGKFQAAWKRIGLELYENGRSQVAREQGFAPIASKAIEREAVIAAVAAVADKQLSDLEFGMRNALYKGHKDKQRLEQVLAAVALVMAAFTQDGSSLDLSIEWITTDAINRGRMDYATATGKSVYGVEWSSVLDGRECSFCNFMDNQVILASSPYYYKIMPPAHHRCRCFLIPIWVPVPATEKILTSIPGELMPLAGMLSFSRKKTPA